MNVGYIIENNYQPKQYDSDFHCIYIYYCIDSDKYKHKRTHKCYYIDTINARTKHKILVPVLSLSLSHLN